MSKARPLESFRETMTFNDTPRAKAYLDSGYLFSEYMFTFMKIIASNVHGIAYFLMILSMINNAGALSVIYPLAVFGYALLEETRPGKGFWRFMIFYTIFVLVVKFSF